MKLRKKIIISASVILVIFLGIMCSLIFSKSSYNLTAKPSIQVFDSVMDAKYSGNTLKLYEDDINSILSMIFKGGITKGDITVYGAEAKIKSSNIYIYSPISFKGIKVLLSASGSLLEDSDQIIFKPFYIKVGRIKLPAHFILSRFKGSKIGFFELSRDSIILNKSSLSLRINGLQVIDDHMNLNFQKEELASNEKPSVNAPASDDKHADAAKATEIKPKTISNPQVKAAPIGQKALKKLSSQLSSALSLTMGDKEKSILSRIKSSVDKKIVNSSYNISGDVSSVKSSYIALTLEERNHIKGAILATVNMENAMELREIFGI